MFKIRCTWFPLVETRRQLWLSPHINWDPTSCILYPGICTDGWAGPGLPQAHAQWTKLVPWVRGGISRLPMAFQVNPRHNKFGASIGVTGTIMAVTIGNYPILQCWWQSSLADGACTAPNGRGVLSRGLEEVRNNISPLPFCSPPDGLWVRWFFLIWKLLLGQ